MIYNWEWIIIGVIVILIFLYGPQKLPQLARSLGLAKREFEKAQKLSEVGVESLAIQPAPSDDKLIEVAKSLGISTEGKTKDQIAREIVEKARKT
ncbi:MAG: twin-arginine translocase TatA/TatE family subunit [Candidatus Nezhaarchaeales archaeon]